MTRTRLARRSQHAPQILPGLPRLPPRSIHDNPPSPKQLVENPSDQVAVRGTARRKICIDHPTSMFQLSVVSCKYAWPPTPMLLRKGSSLASSLKGPAQSQRRYDPTDRGPRVKHGVCSPRSSFMSSSRNLAFLMLGLRWTIGVRQHLARALEDRLNKYRQKGGRERSEVQGSCDQAARKLVVEVYIHTNPRYIPLST